MLSEMVANNISINRDNSKDLLIRNQENSNHFLLNKLNRNDPLLDRTKERERLRESQMSEYMSQNGVFNDKKGVDDYYKKYVEYIIF